MQTIDTRIGTECMNALCDIIISNKAYLSEVDGAIGDGDHGINMAKGFSICKETLAESNAPLTIDRSFDVLANILMGSIGGSMGPLYGSLFLGMSDAVKGQETIDADQFARMLEEGLASIQAISDAKQGDKCLMDTLIPAVHTFRNAVDEGRDFDTALQMMSQAAEEGRDSTKDLVARIGRASRLGERSRGVLDAGSVSCCMLLTTLAEVCRKNLQAA